jgi:hypothetical protein
MTPRERRPKLWRLLAGQLLVVSLLSGSPAFAATKMQDFLILYSYGWPAEQVTGRLTELSARRIAAAHYNTVMCEASQLELVAKAGLRCLVIGRSQGPPDWIGESVSPLIARALASNPAVWGYYVTDEPDNKNEGRGATFQQLAERVKDYRAADPNHVAWINMTSATGGFLSNYIEDVKPDILSFDLYRWWAKESDWWRGLEAHREAALNAGVPMIMWIESNSSEQRFNAHLPPPENNSAKIRWSVYTSLAYGSKGVQWFIGSTDDDVANINAELAALGPTLIRLESKRVFHTSEVPREGMLLTRSNWYFTAAENLVIGEFVKHDEPNATYFLIANKSIDSSNDAVFEIRQRMVSVVEEVNKRSVGRTALPVERETGVTRVRLHLSAGDGRLIRVATR